MEARYALRKSQLLDECQMAPEIFEQVMPRLHTFMKPFVRIFQGQAAAQHAKTYVCGLLSNVERKNIESIAYRFGQSRLSLQSFMGWDAWDDAPLREELRGQVKTHLGQGDGVLVFDPSGFPKSGRESVGWHGNGVAAWAKSITARWPSTWAMSPARGTPWSTPGCICPKNGPRIRPAWTKRLCPKHHEPIARVTSWLWRCLSTTVPRCRIGGLRVTTRWGARIGFVVDWRPWVSSTCWPCLRTRRCVIWRSSPQSRAAGGVGPSVPGSASRRGVNRLLMRPGSGSMCAMVPKALWWWRR